VVIAAEGGAEIERLRTRAQAFSAEHTWNNHAHAMTKLLEEICRPR
jgi:hypothetical protein